LGHTQQTSGRSAMRAYLKAAAIMADLQGAWAAVLPLVA
jgi:hypothetical protein